MSSKVSRSALRRHKGEVTQVKVALLGLNRITGSIGLALRGISERPTTNVVFTVIGRDEDKEAMKAAHQIGAVDNFNRTLQTVVEDADIVFVNEPLSLLEELFARMGDMLKPGAVVIDLSPIKRLGVSLAEKHFPKDADGKPTVYLVGATPLVSFDQLYATNHSVEGAQEYLFRESDILIAPQASVPVEAVKVVTDLADMMNMKPRFLDPSEYDGLASLTEAVPLLLNTLMMQVISQSPGQLDILRASNTTLASTVQNLRLVTVQDLMKLWLTDKSTFLAHIDQVIASLQGFRELVADEDPLTLETHLEKLLEYFISWEVRREQNRWDYGEAALPDDLQVGVPVIGAMFARRRRRDDELD